MALQPLLFNFIYATINCHTKEQRVVTVKMYYKYGECYVQIANTLPSIFNQQNALNCSIVKKLIKKKEPYSTADIKSPRHCLASRSLLKASLP